MLHPLRFSILACIFAPSFAAAADWPQFRGPDGNGHAEAKNLPQEWGPDKNVAWRTEVPGKGWSSPSLSQGRIYLTSAVPVEQGSGSGDVDLVLLCHDAGSGKQIWAKTVFRQDHKTAPAIHRKNSHASPTPLVDGSRIFVHFGHQGTACLTTGGEIVWQNQSLKYPPVHGNGGSPILVDGILIFSCDGGSDPFVVGLDADSGQVKWKFERPTDSVKKFAFSTAEVIVVGGQKQVISPGAGMVNALDPQTGKEIWRVTYDGYSVIPKPVYGNGLVYLSTGYDSPTIIAIRPDGRGDVTDTHVVWTLEKGAPHTPSPLLIGKELYLVSDRGIASCVDGLTGETIWQERVPGDYSASPLYADGQIYIVNEEGTGTVLRPGRTFERLAENGFLEQTLASYAVGEGAIFVRTEKALYRIGKLR
ncbi:MAG TPA: PQQ-binding-like beta-propeller repeat protein [Pirellulaceae bacterium]|nr:PQQ-binding-like beta-propeller repeat protein [Pirellulaceae bacterium]